MTKFLPFAYDQDGFYTNQKCFIITGESHLKYITGYFNSTISAKWIYENCPKLGSKTRELSKVFFENIPIPVPNKKEQRQIDSLVDEVLSNQKHLSQTKTRHDKILVKERIDKIDKIDKQINRIFYRLYGLTSEEISLVEKQSS